MRKTLTLGELKPNPFKKAINGGKLWPNKIEELKRSITKNGLWEFFVARYVDGEYQIANHHHTLAAAIEVLGKKHEVSIQIEKYDDSHMLSAMADENSEEGTPGVDLRDTVLTVKKFLQEHPEACRKYPLHGGEGIKGAAKKHECGSQPCLAAFFSRLGEATVQRYAAISDEVAPYVSGKGQSHPERTGAIGVVAAAAISTEFKDDPESQNKVIKVVIDANKGRNEPLITTKDITEAMKAGDPIEALKETIKNKKLDEAIEQEEKAKSPTKKKGKKKRKVMALVKPKESISNLIDSLSLDGVQARFMELVPYEAAKSLHRELVKLYHPDKGGNVTKMAELNLLWKRIEKDQYERGAK